MSAPFGLPAQAMVLAAGLGVRVRPLTARRAKPSLPLMNRPLLLHTLDLLARHGVRRAVINVHHEPESLERLLDAGAPPGMSIDVSREAAVLGTSGGIRAAMPHLDPSAPLLLLNADSLSDADLGAAAAAFDDARAAAEAAGRPGPPALMAVRPREAGEPYAPVHLDAEGLVAGIGEAGERGEAVTFMGLHVVSPEAIARIPLTGASDIVRDVYQPFLREGRRIAAYRHPGWWVEIGSPALYLRAHLALLDQPRFLASLPADAGSAVAGEAASFAGSGCDGLERATLRSAVLGPGCRLMDASAVVGSVLGRGAYLGRGARVESSIVWEEVEVPEGVSIKSCLLLPAEEAGAPIRSLPLA